MFNKKTVKTKNISVSVRRYNELLKKEYQVEAIMCLAGEEYISAKEVRAILNLDAPTGEEDV